MQKNFGTRHHHYYEGPLHQPDWQEKSGNFFHFFARVAFGRKVTVHSSHEFSVKISCLAKRILAGVAAIVFFEMSLIGILLIHQSESHRLAYKAYLNHVKKQVVKQPLDKLVITSLEQKAIQQKSGLEQKLETPINDQKGLWGIKLKPIPRTTPSQNPKVFSHQQPLPIELNNKAFAFLTPITQTNEAKIPPKEKLDKPEAIREGVLEKHKEVKPKPEIVEKMHINPEEEIARLFAKDSFKEHVQKMIEKHKIEDKIDEGDPGNDDWEIVEDWKSEKENNIPEALLDVKNPVINDEILKPTLAGFQGLKSKPIALSDEEKQNILKLRKMMRLDDDLN